MDPTINPCDNFYKFACGGFLKKNDLPKDKASISLFQTLNDQMQEQLKQDLNSPPNDEDSKPWKMTKQFYGLCMDTAKIDNESEQELVEFLKNIGGWPVIEGNSWDESAFRWENLIYKLREMGDNPEYFFGLDIGVDPSNSSTRIIQLSPAKPGLSYEHLYTKAQPALTYYFMFLFNLPTILGADLYTAQREMEKILEFEIELVERYAYYSDPTYNDYEPFMTVEELESEYPNIPWTDYLNEYLKPHASIQPDEKIFIQGQGYFEAFSELLETTPKRVLANYAISKFVQGSAPFLSGRMREAASNFKEATTGIKSDQPREIECLTYTSVVFSIALSAHYGKNYFDKSSKDKAVEIMKNIRSSFEEILDEIDWMDNGTRSNALEKLDWMLAFVAYPNELVNDEIVDKYYGNLTVDTGSLFKSLLNYGRFSHSKLVKDLRKPIKRNDWVAHSETAVVNAYYSPADNSIIIPAGILQGHFFTKGRPNYLNYGTTGWVLGHEMTHGFDDQGSEHDKTGNVLDWWDSKTKDEFLERAKCMIKQYSHYKSDQVHMNVHGKNTIGENIADNGGLKEAYRAYNKKIQRDGVEPGLPGLPYTPKQLFWISAANIYCSKTQDLNLKYQIMTDEHAPEEFRVIGTMSNMPEFSEDFSCPARSKMNPVEKCEVW